MRSSRDQCVSSSERVTTPSNINLHTAQWTSVGNSGNLRPFISSSAFRLATSGLRKNPRSYALRPPERPKRRLQELLRNADRTQRRECRRHHLQRLILAQSFVRVAF